METFSHLVNKAALGGFLSGYKVRCRGREELQITHLLWFEALSGMCINLETSSIMPVGETEDPEMLT